MQLFPTDPDPDGEMIRVVKLGPLNRVLLAVWRGRWMRVQISQDLRKFELGIVSGSAVIGPGIR